MLVVPGQKVRQGQPMLYVASPDYSQLRTNYLKAKDAYSLAQKTYARAQDLYQHHAIAEKIWSRRNQPKYRPEATWHRPKPR